MRYCYLKVYRIKLIYSQGRWVEFCKTYFEESELKKQMKQEIAQISLEPVALGHQLRLVPEAIHITDAAQKQIARILARKQATMPGAFLRVGVKGGGCSGLSYAMEPDTEFDERDCSWTTESGVQVVVDEKSLEFINGMTIDYSIKNLMEGGFVYENPNAARSCGCGTSFTPK